MPKRRANHEGTIYKRQDGRWVASVTRLEASESPSMARHARR